MKPLSNESVGEYFRNALASAACNQQLALGHETEFYLVNLLSEFTRVQPDQDAPLALMYAQASSAPVSEKVRILRKIGDIALYLAGFFADSFRRKVIDVDYYCEMGGAAYNHLSQAVRTGAPVYGELAHKFVPVVDVLNEISERSNATAARSDLDLLRLYERWLKTGSQRLHGFLLERGMIPQREDGNGSGAN